LILDAARIDRLQNPDHPYVGYDLRTLGDLMLRKPDVAAAERYYDQALAIYRKNSGDRISTGSVLRGLALVRLEQRRPADAERMLREALAGWEQLADDHADKAHLSGLLGVALERQGRDPDAEPLLTASHRILVEKDGPRTRRAPITRSLIEIYRRTGRAADTAGLVGQ
jgi:tetratricopeptide (TPR) repeat protein